MTSGAAENALMRIANAGEELAQQVKALSATIEKMGSIYKPQTAPSAPARKVADGEPVFPPYGRNKGGAIVGASIQDLEFYANACRRSIADPSKSRFHAKERALLGAIEAEIARQGGVSDAPPPIGEDLPF